MPKHKIIASFLALSMLVVLGAGCFGGGGSSSGSQQKVTLKYWRVFDDEDTMEGIIEAYENLHPNVTIDYKKLRPEEYESELIRAIAAGEGPDIFSVHNAKMNEFQKLLLPLPSELNISYLVTKGTLRKESFLEARQEKTPTVKAFKQGFVDVVSSDALLDYQPDEDMEPVERIYGVPLAVDTLALFYNKDLLNSAGIANPPATWDEFLAAVIKLTKLADDGSITQSGAALGTADNVERVTDIISVLMLQNGTQMTDDRGRVAFHTIPEGTPREVFPGLDAVRFYTDFANPTIEAYTWNDEFPNSREAFANGATAFYLGYSYDIPLIKSAAPKLDFAVAPLPQISGGKTVNFANYWLEGVSKMSKNSDYAWNFLLFASGEEQVPKYLTAAKKPTALRSLIATQVEDPELEVFVSQLLTAKSWYHGLDAEAMEKAFKDLAKKILLGVSEPEDVLEDAARVVQQTY